MAPQYGQVVCGAFGRALEESANRKFKNLRSSKAGTSRRKLRRASQRARARRNRARSLSSRSCARSCSHIRTTVHPAERKARDTTRSLSLVRVNFGTQNPFRDLGNRAWRGHPCQKQPSTNSATRLWRQTKSGEPSSRARRRQPTIPAVRNTSISLNSVLLLPEPRTRDMRLERSARVSVSILGVESFPVFEFL
jgi:hypothetical protein